MKDFSMARRLMFEVVGLIFQRLQSCSITYLGAGFDCQDAAGASTLGEDQTATTLQISKVSIRIPRNINLTTVPLEMTVEANLLQILFNGNCFVA